MEEVVTLHTLAKRVCCIALIVAFLQGKQTPTVEFFGLDADPNRLSATWRVFFDYGAALGDSRAAYRAKGEA